MDFGRDECEGDAPAGIRTRVGSSGGSQDIHYPTRADKRHMDVSPYEQDVEEYNNYGIARMVLCILLPQRNETDEVFPPLRWGERTWWISFQS